MNSDEPEKETLEELLNPPESKELVVHQEPEPDDYEFTRQNVREVVQQGRDAIMDLLDVCRSSGHPRAFEALAKLIDSVTNANRSLMDNKETDTSIKIASDRNQPKNLTQNLFVGSTAELSTFINRLRREGKEKDVDDVLRSLQNDK